VAGMLRSFDYAAWTALDRLRAKSIESQRAAATAGAWRERAAADFLAAYEAARGQSANPGLLRLFLLQKVCDEIGYEAANRPGWVSIPVRGALALLDEAAE